MDRRISWIKNSVYAGLGLKDDVLFEHMLARKNQKVRKELITFLDLPSEEYSPAIIFYCIQHEVDEMVEVVEGKWFC